MRNDLYYNYIDGNKAYVAIPLRVTAVLRGKPYDESGETIYTLVRIGSNWKITSQIWAKQHENFNPLFRFHSHSHRLKTGGSMKIRSLVILTALAIGMTLPAVAAGPSAAIMAPINHVIADTNKNDTSHLNSYFTSNAVIIDEFAPHMWTGANAGVAWWSGLMMLGQKMHFSNMNATAGTVKYFSVDGATAYVVVPLTVTSMMKGKQTRETGLWTITLARSGGAWKISSASWGTLTNSM